MGGGECRSNDYGAAAYWDARYSSPSPSSTATTGGGGGAFFDWYQAYPALRPLLRARLPASSRVLMLGCGNSLLSEDMVKDGYEEVVNVDISSVVIEQMREKHVDIPQLTCSVFIDNFKLIVCELWFLCKVYLLGVLCFKISRWMLGT
jgi:SAM-dependent methyltransferase